MSNLFSTYGTSLLFLLSIYGWGRVLAQISYKNNLPGWAFTCTLGITLLMFIGGVLNALNIANSDTLFSLLFIGIVLSILCHFLDYRPFNPQNKITRLNIIGNSSSLNFSLFFSRLLETIILLTVFIFLSAALMPTSSFNFHDDFHTYLVRPVRMLQTGTLGGNLFDIIGFDSLGTQSFFQAFTLLWNSNNTINAFDAIICFVLTAGIILELGCKLKINILFSLLAVVLFAAINPHYANISSLYSGALMLLAVTYAYVMLNDAFNSGNLRESIWASMPVALCLATLFSLKITFIFAFLLALSGNIIFSLFLTSSRKKAAITNSCCLAACIVFLLPWLSLYFEKYMKKIYFVFKDAAVPITSSAAINNSLFSDTITKLSDNWQILLSNYDLFYGNSYRDYTTVILMLLVVSVTAMSMLRTDKGNSSIIPIIISIVIGALNYVLLSTYFTPRLIVRYSCPITLAAAPLTVLMVGMLFAQKAAYLHGKMQRKPFFLKITGIFLLFILLLSGANFIDTFKDRLYRARYFRTLISFPLGWDKAYLEYNKYALGEDGKRYTAYVQNLIAEGETIFAYISTPFNLDFSRNKIYSGMEPALGADWLRLPLNSGPAALRQHFIDMGITYLMWEHQGYGMKSYRDSNSSQKKFLNSLASIAKDSDVIFDDRKTVVFNIRPSH